AADFSALLGSRREHNDRRAPRLFFRAKAAAQLEPAHTGQIQVEDDQIRGQIVWFACSPHRDRLSRLPLAERYVQARFAGERDLGHERSVAFQVVADAFGDVGIVFDDEYKGFHKTAGVWWLAPEWLVCGVS